MKYFKILDDNLEFQNDIIGMEFESKLEYIGNVIFDFTTYDDDMDVYLAKKMISIIKVILDGDTYDYVQNISNYHNYITMVNMPFLIDKINWGTSIRGSWIEGNKDYVIDFGRIIIKKDDIEDFLISLISWYKEK